MENLKQNQPSLQALMNTAAEDGNIRPTYVRKVIAGGTDVQKQQLNERLQVYGLTIEDYEITTQVSEKEKMHLETIQNPDMTKAIEKDHIGGITHMIYSDMGLTPKRIPENLNFQEVRKLVWGAFVNIVAINSKIHPDDVKATPHQVEYLRNMTYYIMGSDQGEWNPNRSLYLYGDLESGKSTLGKVLHFVSKYIDRTFKWDARTFDFCSMDELFLQTYSSQRMDKVSALTKGFYVLDELKEKHKDYKHYGNEFLLLDDILTVRYNLWSDRKKQTVITSNLDPNSFLGLFADDKFQTKEGENRSRLISRIKQQYLSIHIEDINLRQLKIK